MGCILPDLIDKPIWLATQWFGVQVPDFETARLIGHSAFLVLAIAIAARLTGARPFAALAYAIPTHLALDVVTDWGRGGGWGVWQMWLFWPFELPRFAMVTAMTGSPLGMLAGELRARVNLFGEVLGSILLLRDFLTWRRGYFRISRGVR